MGDRYDEDVAFIRSLAELLRETDLTELEVKREFGEDDALNVRVSRQPALAAPAPVQQVVAAAAPSVAPAPSPAAPLEAAGGGSSDLAQHPGAITSPMVGTVYLQSEPGSAAFVSVGDAVKEGQTLLIIEAMKTMNQIAASRAGTVRRILVDDGSPVEFGAPLMIVE